MSTLKTHNLQSPDAGSVNIALTANAGMIVTGISTFNDRINIGSLGVTTNFTVAGISTFSGDVFIPDKIIHSGDTNTSLRFPAADTITAETGGSERLRIAPNGAVSINYAGTGDNTLHIGNTSSAGGIIIKSPGDHYANIVIDSNRSGANNGILNLAGKWNGNDVAYISFTTGTDTTNKDDGFIRMYTRESGQALTERLQITTNGHLLLGTSTDYADSNSDDVQIYGTGDTGMSITSGTSHYGSIYFGDGTSGDSRNKGIVRYHHSVDAMEFWTNAGEKARIDSSGRLYLGATSGGNADTDDLVINGSGKKGITICSTDGSESRLTFADGLSGVNAVAGNITYTHSNDSLDFYTATTRRLRITNAGRVGINEDSPDTKLQITHSNATEDVIKLLAKPVTAATGERSRIVFHVHQSNNQAAKLGHIASHTLNGWGGELAFHTKPANGNPNNSTNEVMRLHANGYVTKPYQPVFSATTSGTSSAGYITFNQTSCNVGGHYSTSNGRFTAPIAGTYYFSFYGMSPHNNTSNQRVAIRVNGNYWSAGQYIGGVGYTGYTNGGYTHLTLSTALPLSANDYVQIDWQYADLHSGHCKFTGFLVG